MPITVRFSSFLREITKENEILLDINEISLDKLLDILCEKYGAQFKNKCIDNTTKNFKSFINIFVNRIPLQEINMNSVVIRDNDTIHFLPAISGG
ncbi:MAG: MoaD/ThiS family protein [Promethearchaeota archaeon]